MCVAGHTDKTFTDPIPRKPTLFDRNKGHGNKSDNCCSRSSKKFLWWRHPQFLNCKALYILYIYLVNFLCLCISQCSAPLSLAPSVTRHPWVELQDAVKHATCKSLPPTIMDPHTIPVSPSLRLVYMYATDFVCWWNGYYVKIKSPWNPGEDVEEKRL